MSKFKQYFSDLGAITKKTAKAWVNADPFRQSAVVAYYAIFSIPALLVIVISCAGLIFGREAIQGQVSDQITGAMGADTAEQVEDMIAKASERKSSIIATIISVVTLILGSTGVFAQLQTSLNQIWEVKVTAKKKWLKTLKDRLFSFGLVLSIGFLMLISLILTAGLQAFNEWIKTYLPDFILYAFQFLNFVISFSSIGVLFALMFKILPDAKVKWRDVWIGAMATTLLFILGKFGLGIYFAKANPGSTYGAAGSIVLIMLWVSYSCMILFFGAEFTKQYAVHFGREIEPKRGAEIISDDQKEKEK
ncbi:MAG: YihY/virulence factor BrkB family protein [Bacteroidetes bacterium]|nr:YihY/virulence factor BrkB family protein [Bacteroidota bacterium]